MKLRVYFKEINYGSLEIEVPDNTTDDEIMEKAWDEFGDCDWGKCDCDITDWEKVEE